MATYLGSVAQLCCGEGGILLACMNGWTTQGLPQLTMGVHLQSIWAPRCVVRSQSQVYHESPQRSWSQAVTLPVDLSCPGSQEDMGSGWLAAHSLAADVVSGAEIAAGPCLLILAVMCLPVFLWSCRLQTAHPTLVFPRVQSFVL